MTTLHVNVDTGEVTGADGELFNGAAFQKPLPALDGHRADTLKLSFSGSVDIDKMIDDDVAWFQGLRFGQELELRVTATVGKHGWTLKTSGDDGETVTHTLGFTVHSIAVDE